MGTPEQVEQLSILANSIWREHYTPIIGEKQVKYMLEKFQSSAAISRQINNQYYYDLVFRDLSPIGYLCVKKKQNDLFLSKIYLIKSERNKGLGKHMINRVLHYAKELNCDAVTLTVNKQNTKTIAAYLKMGFVQEKAIVMDIGNGFVMDDYQMRMSLTNLSQGQ